MTLGYDSLPSDLTLKGSVPGHATIVASRWAIPDGGEEVSFVPHNCDSLTHTYGHTYTHT